MAKQVLDIRGTKGFTSSGESNEILRVAWEGAYKAVKSNAFDPTRAHLDFEIKKGGVICDLDKSTSIGKRERDNITARGVKDPNEKWDEPRYRTVVDIIFGGSTERMRELAFGDQNVDFEKGADNSSIKRMKDIENWALDTYNFVAKKYGEENIAAFVVHLDEKNPHVHCKILPITEQNKFSFRKVMVGDDNSKEAFRNSTLKLHNEYYEQVGKKYGLDRGDHVSETNAKHRTTEEYHAWRRQQLKKEVDELQDESDELKSSNESLRNENENLTRDIIRARARLKALQTMIDHLERQKQDLEDEIRQLEKDRAMGKISLEEYEERFATIKEKLADVNNSITDKQQKLAVAEKQLAEVEGKVGDANNELGKVQQQVAEAKEKYNKIQEKYDAELPKLHKQALTEMQAIGMMDSLLKVTNFQKGYEDLWNNSSDQQRMFLDNNVAPLMDKSGLDDIADKSIQITKVATCLYMGYLDKATDISVGGGGAAGPGRGWGREKDEDDWSFKKRCFMTATGMMRPARKRGIKR